MPYQPGSPGAYDQPPPAAGPDMRFIGRVLAARKWTILGIMTAVTALTAFGVSTLSDNYSSEALLLVDSRQVRIVRETDQVVGAMPAEDAAILSEIEILKSDHILKTVVADLDLKNNPEFNKPATGQDGEPLSAQVMAFVQGKVAAVWGDAPPESVATALDAVNGYLTMLRARETAAQEPAGNPDRILERLHRKLEVGIVGRSRVIRVAYTAKSPEVSAAIVNDIVRRYMETRQQMDRELATGAVTWLRERIGTLRQEVMTAEQQSEQYRFKSGLLKGATGPLAVASMEQTRMRLAEAEATRARAVAQADALERYMRSGNWNAIGGSLVSPVVSQLRATVATLQTEMAQVTKQYGPKHPRVIELQARLSEAYGGMQNEIRREINGVRETANVAIEQEKALREMIDKTEGKYADSLSDEGVKLRSLEAEASAKRQLLEQLMGRLEEVQAQQDNRAFPAGVKLVSQAQVPHEPSGPMRVLLIVAGFFASILLAVVAVFALELLQRRLHTPEALRRILGASAIHVVPHHPVRKRSARLYEVFQRHPFSLFSESLRALFRNHLADLGPVGSIAVTSARPQDGKTSMSLAVAQVASQAGRRVVVVDTDFRRSRIDHLFGMSGKAGLSDWIAGNVALDEIIHHSADVPFALVPAGKLMSSTLDRFNVDCVVELMAGLSPHFDLVVFDTAPVLAVSDARVVSAAASKVLFVTRWGHTTASDLQGVADLGPIDYDKFVCVLTDVNLKKAAQNGYAGPYRNYTATRKYYGEPTRLRAVR
jgi:uncharacterized protein involved in exopolysaccharide biosynthesis/Mrp family chromosome partitioning ATPase